MKRKVFLIVLAVALIALSPRFAGAERFDFTRIAEGQAIAITPAEINCFTSISFISAKASREAYLEIKPIRIPFVTDGILYNSCTISAENLSFGEAKIDFSVSRDWLRLNGISESGIRVKRFGELGGKLIPTAVSGRNPETISYSAFTPSFSDFGIIGHKEAPKEMPLPSLLEITEGPQYSWLVENSQQVGYTSLIALILLMIILVMHFKAGSVFRGIMGKKVFTEKGKYLGKVKGVLLERHEIHGFKIVLDKKQYITRDTVARFKDVVRFGKYMIVKDRTAGKLRRRIKAKKESGLEEKLKED